MSIAGVRNRGSVEAGKKSEEERQEQRLCNDSQTGIQYI